MKTFKDMISEDSPWLDFDQIQHLLAKSLGITHHDNLNDVKWLYWSDNPIGNMLYEMIEQMRSKGMLEISEDGDQYRWNHSWKLKCS